MSRRSRRKKYINRKKKSDAQRQAEAKRTLIIVSVAVFLIVAAVIVFYVLDQNGDNTHLDVYDAKAQLLKAEVLSGSRNDEISDYKSDVTPLSAVFISVSSGSERARVFSGTGSDAASAWNKASELARAYVGQSGKVPKWVKADLMCDAARVDAEQISTALDKYTDGYLRWGISFDRSFNQALLESELSANKILDYDNACIDLKKLNSYLKKTNSARLAVLPDEYYVFQCIGWLCDEDNSVLELSSADESYGRRLVDTVDKEYAASLVRNGAEYLLNQINRDGSFVYGIYPRFDNEMNDYNILRHAGAVWSLICQYRLTHDDSIIPTIDKAIDYMIDEHAVYRDDNTAYLIEKKSYEIKLGGCGIAALALSEYKNTFGSDKYDDFAVKLGNGILTMLDQSTGKYYHVLNPDYSRKEEFRTVYYDGEATFALCRLYSLTGDEKWLDAAKSAVGNFIKADYVHYKDHWIAYAMNEITKYVHDDSYYTFALRNAQENLKSIYNRTTTGPIALELLMSTFIMYDRMMQEGVHVDYLDNGFDLSSLLRTIYRRIDYQLNGYFYPEYAMYMENPDSILNTFMMRDDGFRVRIDDVQHNIGGYLLYYENYDKLVSYGMLECRDKT